MILELRK